ncbi:DUF262 domain-containing protein [Peribacillus simplex]|uniref:DUF262 domain-containing protein n=2 Tax=Peribacillus TaxID=2675229 RepID=A0AA90PDI3_9BACI|nr:MULTISPECIES: DUF262 domain-containing protein [Peribacillus]MDP1421152.1 DUF262 domain-containing protein [Peribacillus simplex]MDP1453919.1 DUF262 domain-containing protein [Peribacillus frigoritolerans]
MIKNGISSELLNIKSFLTEDLYKFLIPDFQRDFVWGQEEVQQLLDDLSEDTNGFTLTEDDLEGYLLGNIVLIKPTDSERYLVVDGQQRLTTTTLICKSLEEIVEAKITVSQNPKEIKKWQMKLNDIVQSYAILDNDDEIKDCKLIHDPALNFGKVYKNILYNKEYEVKLESDSKIEEVYTSAKDYLEALSDEQLKNFISYIKSRVYFIVTVSTSYNKAFQLFEVLNDRGRSLEPLDLVKNLFLKTISKVGKSKEDVEEFNNDWNEFISNLQVNPKKKISSSTFLKHFIIGKYAENIKKDLVYDYFETKKLTTDEIFELVKDLKYVSKIYAELEKGNYKVFLDDHNMFIIFKLFNIKQLHSLLIPFYKADQKLKEQVLDLGVRLGASVLFTFTQMNFIESILPSILEKYYEDLQNGESGENAYKKLDAEAKKIILSRSTDIKQILPLRKLVNANGNLSNKAAVILKFIELYFHGNSTVIVPPKKQKITVEHILSKEIIFNKDSTDAGFISEEDFKNHINLIGNLTLLYNNENSSVGNKKFNDKIKLYSDQDFIITQRVARDLVSTTKGGKNAKLASLVNERESKYVQNLNGHFDKDSIKERSSKIGDLIYDLVNQNIII